MNDLAFSKSKGLHFCSGPERADYTIAQVVANCAARQFRVLPSPSSLTPLQTLRKEKRRAGLVEKGWKMLLPASTSSAGVSAVEQ